MAQGAMDILAQLGEMSEITGGGQRFNLPDGHYPVVLAVEGLEYSPLSETRTIDDVIDPDTGEAIKAGHTPYVQFTATVSDGPFAGCDVRGRQRQYLTPGKGSFIGFIQSLTKAITQKAPDAGAFAQFGFDFEGANNAGEIQQALRLQWLALDAEARTAFMRQFARVGEWDGKPVIVTVRSTEPQERTRDDGTSYVVSYNEIRGYHSVNDEKHGIKALRQGEFKKQAQWAAELGVEQNG